MNEQFDKINKGYRANLEYRMREYRDKAKEFRLLADAYDDLITQYDNALQQDSTNDTD